MGCPGSRRRGKQLQQLQQLCSMCMVPSAAARMQTTHTCAAPALAPDARTPEPTRLLTQRHACSARTLLHSHLPTHSLTPSPDCNITSDIGALS